MSVVLFSLMAAVVTVEAQKSGNAPMRIPWLEDLFQLSGVMMGNEMPTTVTEGLDLELGDSCGPITNPTNSTPVEALRFFGIAATSTNVWLGIEWPLGEVPSPLDLYGSWTLSPTYWTRLAELDVSSALSNAVVRHQWQLSCSNLVASGHWPTNATGSMGFFQLAKRLDSDGDQVLDGDETLRYGTDPLNPDTDGDGDSDGWEIDRGFDPCRQEPGINPYPLHSATTSEGGGNVPSGGSAVPEGGSACTNELKYGFFGFTTSFGGPEADYTGNDWPPANFGDGLPQISKDESHAYGTFIVSLSSRGWFRPSVTSNYVFSVAADDDAQFLIGGSGASVTWKNDGGNPAYFSVDLVGGVCYPVSVDWNTVGGPLFLTLTGGSVESAETGPYHPKIKADPHLITFTIAAGVALEERAATATIIGECDPDKRYEIAVEAGEGLAASGALAHPVEAGGYWEDGRFSVAVFRLLENGNEIDSDCCVFVSEPVKERNECGCCREGTVMDNGCVMFSQAFGSTPNRSGLPTGSVVVRASRPSASLYTAAALRYNHPMMRRLHYQRNLDAVVLDGLGEATEYRRGFPSGVSAGVGGQFFRDSNGRFVEELPDGLRVIYGDTGAVVALQPRNGEPVAVADLGITVARNADGDITAITSVTDGVMTAVTLNPQSSSPACPCWRLVWTSPVGAAVKRFDFGGSFAAGSFTLHEYRSERYQFDYRWDYDAALQDFVFEKGAGTTDALREEKTLAYNPVHKVWTSIRSRRDTDGNVISATSSVLDRNRHTLHATERRDVVSGKLLYAAVVSSAGWVALETNALGRITEYVRDQYGRVTRETIVAEGVPTEVREYGYTSDAYPLEFRPAWKRTSVGGSTTLEETFAYGTTSDGHSTITHVRSCCGASRTSFMEYDAAARPILAVGEDGRATLTNYSEPDADGVVVETADDGVLGDAGFIMVSGKSTREIRFRNAAGDVVRREQYALVDDDWRQLAWSTHAYNASHREIATAHSDGTNSAADWICQGPVWCTDRNGVTVSNDYSAAKLLLRTTRYGAFGPVATQYTRNADGRIVAETTTAADCETQTVTRSYDSRGRVVSETAADGATTTTSYSADDRTKTTNYADGGTRIEVFNADGSTASVTGSAVTPEFTTYGVETIVVNGVANPCRTMTVRKGFANSPRCEKRFVNGFGETIRVETAGFGNAVNVQERCYDGNGRLVGQTETGRPSLAYTYDLFGGLAGETKTAGGESRMTVVDRSFVVEDGIVFESTATTRSCSDSAIVPLVEARRIRRSGLTLDENACTVDTDVRGNVTVRRVAVDPVNRRRVETVESPKVVNVATNWFVDGVSVSNVTSTGVCEQRTYDAYRRETARIDGRGNATMRNYNPLGRLARVVDASGAATSYAYDALGRVTEITNAVGNVTTRAYDHCGNLLAEGGAVYPVTYGYDVYGERVSLTTWRDVSSQIGDTTTWTRDAATGLVTAKTYADGHGPVYAYDAQGRQIQRTWARGIVTTYTYDSWGNLTGTAYSDDTPPVSRTYDALGRIISVTDVKGMTTYAYDAYGDVTSESVVGLYVKTLTRHHDQYGRDIGHSADGERTST